MSATAQVPSLESLRCPLCDYDLRASVEPRCPECGFQFTWEELTDPTRRRHPYLFEHQLNRPVRAFFRTLLGGLMPRRFWRSLYPTQPSNLRRLALYYVLAMLPLLLELLMTLGFAGYWLHNRNLDARASQAKWWPRSPAFTSEAVQRMIEKQWPLFPSVAFLRQVAHQSDDRPEVVLVIGLLLWPWLTLAGMMIFQITMRRASIRRAHVLRGVMYSADLAFFVGVLAAAWTLLLLWPPQFLGVLIGRDAPMYVYVWLLVGSLPILLYRHWQSIGRYLRFRHAFLTALSVQLIVWMVMFSLLLASPAWRLVFGMW